MNLKDSTNFFSSELTTNELFLKFSGLLGVNLSYPCKTLFYDFKISINGIELYVELCGGGMSDDDTYDERQFLKKKTYNSILVGCAKINRFVKDLKEGRNVDEHEYY